MGKVTNKTKTLEILVSTMNRVSLSFLSQMFPENNFENYSILVVNQTEKDTLLESPYTNVRVINSFEKGLPQSRNLALKNAQGDICLIADDDVKYKVGFDRIISDAFTTHLDADIITFKMVDENGNDFKPYQNIKQHSIKTVRTVNSVVIALDRKRISESNTLFDEHFGLGTTFQSGDEYVFLRNALQNNLDVKFEPKVILTHKFESSGRDAGSDRIIFARAALFYKYSGVLGYLRLCKYLYMIYRQDIITFKDLLPKYKVGVKGIKHYKSL